MDKSKVNKKNPQKVGLYSYLKPYRLLIFICMFCTVIFAAINIWIGYLMNNLVGAGFANSLNSLWSNLTYMFIIIFEAIILFYIVKYSSGWVSAHVIQDMRMKLSTHLTKVKAECIDNKDYGETVSLLTNNISVIGNFLENEMFELAYQPLVFIAASLYVMMISWQLLLASAVAIIFTIVISMLINAPLNKAMQNLQSQLGEVNAIAHDSISNAAMVKALNLYEVLAKKYEDVINKTLKIGLSIEKRLSLVVVANMVLRVLPMLICILYGGYLSAQGLLSAADFVTVLYLFGYIGSSSGRIPALSASLRMVTGSFEHLMSIVKMPQEKEKEVLIPENRTDVLVEFENVDFHYNEGTKVISKLSFKLEKGKINAIVGFSGSGKSTLIKMICGFYEPVAGSVKLFGADIKKLSTKYIRERIALVAQDTFLYPVTVAENIGYGKAGATLEEIIEVSKAVHAHEFIIKLPQGYNTVLGEYGAGLSGGQKQRISLARAILKKAPVILMDEPTAALDSETEALFQETLEILRKEHAVLVISHRLSTIKNADCIFVMEDGCIKDKGTHSDLIKKSSLYSQLYIDQSVMCQEEILDLKEVF